MDQVFMYMDVDEVATDLLLYKMTEGAKKLWRRMPYRGREMVAVYPAMAEYYRLKDQENPYVTKTTNYSPGIGNVTTINSDKFCEQVVERVWQILQ